MRGKNNDRLYPSFRREIIDVVSEVSPHWLLSFPSHLKRKRKDDIVVFGPCNGDRPSEISFYENPRNRDHDEGVKDDDQLNLWGRLALQSIKFPSFSVTADISGNGFSDLIVTSGCGIPLENMDPYGGRISWLENFGTDEGDWTRRDIGSFPGINCVKVGHFSTTFSLQILAVVKSQHSGVRAPLVVFTRPADVYKSREWLVSIALDATFTAIQDCAVIKGAVGTLDYVVTSSREGLTLVWYCDRSWHHRPLLITGDLDRKCAPGQMCTGRINNDQFAYIVVAEANKGSVLSLYSRKVSDTPRRDFLEVVWKYSTLDDFTDSQCGASILDILCADLDGDGVDEIIVSVSSAGSRAGIYCYALECARFVKYKLSNESALKIVPGHFAAKDRTDLATLSRSLPREISIHYHSFVSSLIKPFVKDSNLVFVVPRSPSSVCETDVIDIAGFVLSLVILPSNASFNIVSDGTEAVKVLHGVLGWIDSQSELIERTRAAGLPGCVTSMLVDSPEGHVRSGNDGAVFVRMRPSRATDSADLRALNVLPSYFPCEVCEYAFVWRRAEQQILGEADPKDLFHLAGFHVRFDDAGAQNVDIAYVHFWAAAPGVSTEFARHNISARTTTPESRLGEEQGQNTTTTCTIRASLSNPGGDSGLVYCADRLDWGAAPPTPFQLARARKVVLPVMYEHSPLWRMRRTDGNDGADIDTELDVEAEYPWHAWVAGRVRQKEKAKWNVWASFDFPQFMIEQDEPQSNDQNCIIF
ncbi:hypothetical protein M0805_004143 [Coniferiporia weirii]|nr:hypothetical protein M0805_004143 [Coniferiporia weirii]